MSWAEPGCLGIMMSHPTRFIVDTGSSTTLIDKKTAMQAGIGPSGTALVSDAGEGRIERTGPELRGG